MRRCSYFGTLRCTGLYHLLDGYNLIICQGVIDGGSVEILFGIIRFDDFVFEKYGELFLEVGLVFGVVQEDFHRSAVE